MLHAEYITGNPFTGKQVWLVRHIKGEYGDPFDWACCVIRPRHFSRTAIVAGLTGTFSRDHWRGLNALLGEMKFKRARVCRRGTWKTYEVK